MLKMKLLGMLIKSANNVKLLVIQGCNIFLKILYQYNKIIHVIINNKLI